MRITRKYRLMEKLAGRKQTLRMLNALRKEVARPWPDEYGRAWSRRHKLDRIARQSAPAHNTSALDTIDNEIKRAKENYKSYSKDRAYDTTTLGSIYPKKPGRYSLNRSPYTYKKSTRTENIYFRDKLLDVHGKDIEKFNRSSAKDQVAMIREGFLENSSLSKPNNWPKLSQTNQTLNRYSINSYADEKRKADALSSLIRPKPSTAESAYDPENYIKTYLPGYSKKSREEFLRIDPNSYYKKPKGHDEARRKRYEDSKKPKEPKAYNYKKVQREYYS